MLQKVNKNSLLLFCCISVHVLLSWYCISQQNICYDEPGYIEYAKRWLHGKPERVVPLDDSKTPVIAIVWIPRVIQQLIYPNHQLTDYGRTDQKRGRYVMVIFSVLVIIYLYHFAKALQLKYIWLGIIFYVIDPLALVYASLINSDLLSGLALLAICYHLFVYVKQQPKKHFYFSILWLGTALVIKQTFLFFVPIYLMLLLCFQKEKKLSYFIQTLVLLLVVVNIWFYGKESGSALHTYQFKSNSFMALQKSLSVVSTWPIPIPKNYLLSLDMLQYHKQLGGSPTNTYTGVYLLGNIKLQGAFWYYYIIHALFKFPVVLLFFIGLLFLLALQHFKKLFSASIIIWLPIVYFFIVLSFFNAFQIGIRHLLIVVPLLYVCITWLLNKIQLSSYKIVIPISWLYFAVSVFYYYPNLIPYTNELMYNKKKVYKVMMDSSIDYGQADSAVKKYMQYHNYQLPPKNYKPGNYVVSMRNYVEQLKQGDTAFNWLVKKYQPQQQLYFTHLVYCIQ